MKTLLKLVSAAGLLLTVVPSFMVFYGAIDKSTHFTLMSVGVIAWFISAPFWMKSPSLE